MTGIKQSVQSFHHRYSVVNLIKSNLEQSATTKRKFSEYVLRDCIEMLELYIQVMVML